MRRPRATSKREAIVLAVAAWALVALLYAQTGLAEEWCRMVYDPYTDKEHYVCTERDRMPVYRTYHDPKSGEDVTVCK